MGKLNIYSDPQNGGAKMAKYRRSKNIPYRDGAVKELWKEGGGEAVREQRIVKGAEGGVRTQE